MAKLIKSTSQLMFKYLSLILILVKTPFYLIHLKMQYYTTENFKSHVHFLTDLSSLSLINLDDKNSDETDPIK